MGLLALTAAAALSGPAAADDSAPRAPQPALRESAPEIFYLEDDAGRLVPVPGFRYRDFVDLLRIKEGLPGLPEPPPAVLEQVVARIDLPRGNGGPPSGGTSGVAGDAAQEPAAPSAGAADASAGVAADATPKPAADQPPVAAAGAARGEGTTEAVALAGTTCRATVELSVRQSRAGWVNLPVELSGLLLTGQPRYEGQGRMLLTAAGSTPEQPGGYRLWLSGSAGGAAGDTRHTILLAGSVAVEATGRQETISLTLPRATASRVEIRSGRNEPLVTVRPPGLAPLVEPADDGGSRITLVGLSGPVKIDIGGGEREADQAGMVPPPPSSAVPQASVESLVRVDGRVAVTLATIRLEHLPADAGTIRVRLPPRASLRGVRAPASLVPPDESAPGTAVIRIDRAADGRAAVELECERAVDPSGRETFDPLGFAVEGVESWRQWGRTSIVVEGDWQVEWDDLGDNRRVDAPPGGRPPGFVAAFASDAQPATLPLRVRPRGSRVVIEPEYRYEVSATRVALDARLRVSVRGAPVSRIVVMLDDWNVDEVGPPGVVDVAAVTTEGRRLVVPFLQPLSGDVAVEIRGVRSIERDAERLGWGIPTPQADLLGPATVVIASQSDIEILPDAAGMRGLVRQVTPASLRPDADRFTLAYRLDGGAGRFEAARRYLPRRVDASIAAQADVDAADTIVRETIRFDVAHVPMEFVTLSVPRDVVRAGTLEVRQNGQLLNPVLDAEPAPPPAAAADAAGPTAADVPERPPVDAVRMRAMLATPLLGAGELAVQFELPTPQLKMETTLQFDLPLVVPADARVGRQSVMLAASDMLSVEPRGEEWKRDVAAQATVAGRIWTASRPQDRLPLALSTRRQTPLGQTVVDAAWLQTRLLGERREDVYIYAITSSAETVALTLPAGVTAAPIQASVDVRLDGETQAGAVRPDGRVVIDLPRRTGSGSWLVEVVVAHGRGGLSELFGTAARLPAVVDLDAPRFPDGTLERRFYWELLLDPDEHALGGPGHWTSQQQWGWGALGLERVPVVSRDVLRAWVSAAAGASPVGGDGEGPAWRETARLPLDMPAPGSRAVYSGVGSPGSARVWVVPTWLLVLAVSGPVLAVALAVVQRPRLRSPPLLLGAAAAASLAAAAVPDVAPLLAQAALPGAVLAVLAAGLRLVVNRGMLPAARPPVVAVSASSITQPAPVPSLILSPSAPPSGEDTPATGRSLS